MVPLSVRNKHNQFATTLIYYKIDKKSIPKNGNNKIYSKFFNFYGVVILLFMWYTCFSDFLYPKIYRKDLRYMRCKNCGFDNQEGRYICENCGSPLFDDNDQIVPETDDPENIPPQRLIDEVEEDAVDMDEEKEKNKKSLIIIIVLAVILVAMIVGIIVAAVTGGDDETTTDPTESITAQTTDEESTETTRRRTTTERTTETTTESTTERTTTTTTTTVARFTVSVDIDGNGSVSGDGTFEAGNRTTLVATPDSGYQFIGWFDNDTGAQVASGTRYTITVDSNRNLTARFSALPTQNEPAEEPADE